MPSAQFGGDIDPVTFAREADIYQSNVRRCRGGERQGTTQRHGTAGHFMTQIVQYFREKQAHQRFIFHDQYPKRCRTGVSGDGRRQCFIQDC